jgi:hypothetical protein
MSKSKILLQLDSDVQASVFDGVVAIDAGIDQLFRHGGVRVSQLRELAYGAMFTRGVDDLRHTAIFVGGSDVAAGEAILAQLQRVFFGPMRVSVMLDSNGANTTAAAAVLTAAKHCPLRDAEALVLAATGPVGSRVVRLLALEGARVKSASRSLARAEAVCQSVAARCNGANRHCRRGAGRRVAFRGGSGQWEKTDRGHRSERRPTAGPGRHRSNRQRRRARRDQLLWCRWRWRHQNENP